MSGGSVGGIDANLPFGEVASRLNTLLKFPEQREASGRLTLLELLRTGQLTAFMFFPGKSDLTVDIPTHYWKDVKTSRFSSVGPNKLRRGVFFLDLSDIAEAVTTAIRAHARSSTPDFDEILLSLIPNLLGEANEDREAYVRESQLDAWFKQNGYDIEEQFRPVARRQGRPLDDWIPVLEALVSILAPLARTNGRLPSIKTLASKVYEQARVNSNAIPAAATIEKKVAKLINFEQ